MMNHNINIQLLGFAAFMLILCFPLIAASQNYRETIAQWTFDNTTEPSTGQGNASLVGGVSQHSATTGSGWRVTDFPDQYEASGTAGAQFMVSTEGFENIVLSFEHRSSGTMSRWAEIQYTINGGSSWQILQNNGGNLTPHDIEYPFEFDFSGAAATNDNPQFGVRIVSIFSPVEFNPEVPDFLFAPNIAYHRARTPGTGGNAYSGEGNWRLLEVTFTGDIVAGGVPVKLAVTSINFGNPPNINLPFSVKVEAHDINDIPASLTEDIQILLTKDAGTGTLGGTLLGTMASGSSSLLFDDVTYDTAEPDVRIMASNFVSQQDIEARPIVKQPDVLIESSGIYVSGPNRIWAHNDSGNTNELFCFDTTGQLLRTLLISNATNIDWEDLAVDDQKRVYINDAGNNNNNRTDLKIYRIPNPDSIPEDEVQAEVINFVFEDQYQFPPPPSNRNFDIEAMIWKSDSLFLFTKNRSNPQTGYSKMYRLPAHPGIYTAQLIDSVYLGSTNEEARVTAADINPVTGELLLLTRTKIVSFRAYPGNRFFDGYITEYFFTEPMGQIEAIGFVDNNRLFITEEVTGPNTGFLYDAFLNKDYPVQRIKRR